VVGLAVVVVRVEVDSEFGVLVDRLLLGVFEVVVFVLDDDDVEGLLPLVPPALAAFRAF